MSKRGNLEAVAGAGLEKRASRYAAKFVNDTDEAPTDQNLARVLGHCARPPRPVDYEDIRRNVRVWRQLRAKRVVRQDALNAVSLDPAMARMFDNMWDGGEDCETVGDQFKAIDVLAVEVLKLHGYEVR